MPAISRIRITNLVFENGGKRYADEIFHFAGHNGVILLENGGGKTVFVQAVLQAVLPHTTLAERKAKDTFALENNPAHLAIEWLINEKPPRYALTAVTLFSSKEGLDSYKYVYEYESGDEQGIEKLPFVRENLPGQLRPASKEEMADYYQQMKRDYLSAAYFTSNREYQHYIEENFNIINAEWKSVARINSAEGEIEGFFEGCKTTTQLVDLLLIPTVQAALAGQGTQDFVDTFERQREHFKKHRQLREKIAESQRVEQQISSYVERYQVYEEARQAFLQVKGEARSLYELAAQHYAQCEAGLAEQEQAGARLREEEAQLQRKQASLRLAVLEQARDKAARIHLQRREEYDNQQQLYGEKKARLQNLEIAGLKAQIQGHTEKIQYYREQIDQLSADVNILALEEKIKSNSAALHYCFLQEEKLLKDKEQSLLADIENAALELQSIEIRHQKQEDDYQQLLAKKAKAEQQKEQAENDMHTIAGQILANPRQEEVGQEKAKWEQRAQVLEKDRRDNQILQGQLREEKLQRQDELAQLRPRLQKQSRSEENLQYQWERLQEEHIGLLLRLKELEPELYAINDIHIQQGAILSKIEGQVENLRSWQEKAILNESQALSLYTFYAPSSYYAADPVVETILTEWQGQFDYLEAGSVYVEKAAQQLGGSINEYFRNYPFWAITLVCRAVETERLAERLRKQAERLNHPVFILGPEQARSYLDNPSATSPIDGQEVRQVFPAGWEINLRGEAFHNWQQILQQNAEQAALQRRQQESQLNVMLECLKQLQSFLQRYPYEETRQLQQSLREAREQLIALDQDIRWREERLEEIDNYGQVLQKKYTEMVAEQSHLSYRITKAQDYIRKAGERDKAQRDLQQYLELLPIQEAELARRKAQIEGRQERRQDLQLKLYGLRQELQRFKNESLYLEVAAILPQATDLSRARLETERQDLIARLHQRQKGRQDLEDLLQQAQMAKNERENDLQRKLLQSDTEISLDFVYPPDGDEELDLLIQQIRQLKGLLRRLQPSLEQAAKEHAIALDRCQQEEEKFLQKYAQRVEFMTALAVVETELRQEQEEIKAKQKYQAEQMRQQEKEKQLFGAALTELKGKNERYDYLRENIGGLDLPPAVKSDFAYQPLAVIAGYSSELQKRQEGLERLDEELGREKLRLERFCQDELRDIKLRRMVTQGLQYRDNYQAVLEWKNRLSNRIGLAIRHAEDDMREHDRELQQFINYLHSHLLTVAAELRLIPRKTRVKVEDNWKEIFLFDVPAWEEKEGKSELRRHVDWMIKQIESEHYHDEQGGENYALIRKDIEKWLQSQQLLRIVMQANHIRVRCRKVTADGKVSSHPSAWEASNLWSGGEKWSKNMALFLGIQNYLAEKRQALNPHMKRNRAVILDNPFGRASSDHVLDPVFFIAEQLGFQIIALTALAEGKFIRDYFPIVYSCRLRPSTSADKYLVSAEQEIRHAYFQDHEPEALLRLGKAQQS